jgi:site-specific recombinase XerD
MIEQNRTTMPHSRRTCVGPLAPHIDGFVESLLHEGYRLESVKKKYDLTIDLNRWMERRKLPLARLDEEKLTQFRISRQRRCKLQQRDMWTAGQLLRYLRDLGCISTPLGRIDLTSLGQLTQDFERYLSSERGLSRSTLVAYSPIARQFLRDRFGKKAVRVKALRPHDIHCFIIRHLKAGRRVQAKKTVSALRSFLRFLRQRNKITIDLAAAVPGVADRRLSHLPRSLPRNQINQLLASCDRTTPSGQRDYAILLLMARLGLRAGEVVKMTLDDLDWTCAEIVVHGKCQHEARLPLPTDVGAALVNYLRYVRPDSSTRRVFIRTRAPRRGLKASAINPVVRGALRRAGLNPEFKGSHLLRHSLATNLQRRGATLTEIGQLLRHNDLTTTQIYAKVDIAALRTIALPWPRGAI